MAPDPRPFTEVAVGLVHRPQSGRPGHFEVLMGQRPAGKPYAGWWEFPGGKIEKRESVAVALARELQEELALQVKASLPWVVRTHSYPHARVRLHFRRIFEWSGEPVSMEGQAFAWQALDRIDLEPLLPAALPLLDMLRWPTSVTLLGFKGEPSTIEDVYGLLQEVLFVAGDRLFVRLAPLSSMAIDEAQRTQIDKIQRIALALGLRIYLDETWYPFWPDAAGLWRATSIDSLACLEVLASESFFETDAKAHAPLLRAVILLDANAAFHLNESLASNMELPLFWPREELLALGGHGYTVSN